MQEMKRYEMTDIRVFKYIKSLEQNKHTVSIESFNIQMEWYKRKIEKEDNDKQAHEYWKSIDSKKASEDLIKYYRNMK